MGADVTVLTSHEEKVVDALRLGATDVVLVSDRKQMARNAATLDFILSTIPQPHDPNPYIELLDSEGIYANVGCLAPLKGRLDMSKMNIDRKSVVTTLIGGIAETQEVLDFCGKHNIGSEIQVISIEDVNAAFQKVDRGEVDFRYVIDMSTLHGKQADESLAAKIGL